MPKKDPRIDAYIDKSAPFAQPVMNHIRELVHEACPEVEETIKWGFPHFDYKGVMISMAAFKSHCSLNIWKAQLIKSLENVDPGESAMGQFGRITSVGDLPERTALLDIFREARRLNEENVKLPKKEKEPVVRELTVPEDLLEALKANAAAIAVWEKFSLSHRKEYVDWITGAKTEPTRQKRLSTAVEWIAEGKNQMWRYSK